MPSVTTSIRVAGPTVDLEPCAKTDEAASLAAAELRHPARDGARRDAPRLQHQQLLADEPRLIEQRKRHDGALAGARRRFEHRTGLRAQAVSQLGQRLDDR